MRTFCVFAAICIVGVYSDEVQLEECARELNLDLEKLNKLAIEKIPTPDSDLHRDAYRLYACQVEKRKEPPVSPYLKNSEEFKQYLEKEDELKNFENAAEIRQNLLSKLTECQSKGLNEIDFLKCIDYLGYPSGPIFHNFVSKQKSKTLSQ